MKRIILGTVTAFTLLPSSGIKADSPNLQWYLGAQAGGELVGTKHTLETVTGAVYQKFNANKGGSFFIGGVFAGVRHYWDDFYAGIEVEGNWDNFKVALSIIDPRTNLPIFLELRRKYQIITSLLFGYKFQESWSIFTKLGLNYSKMNYAIDRDDRLLPGATGIKNRNIIGFIPSIGIERDINDHASLRFDVSSEVVNQKIKLFKDLGPLLGGVATENAKVKFQSIAVKFGVFAKF